MADDTLAREESEDDRLVIGTIHAAKGREYHSVVIPDYDCDVSRWEPPEVEEERRVVYVGVTRARDAVLFTVDTASGFVHPFLRELVETPQPDEHESLSAWMDELDDGPAGHRDTLLTLIADRLSEIETLFPELAPEARPEVTAATVAATAPAARRSASPSAACPASGTGAGPPATRSP